MSVQSRSGFLALGTVVLVVAMHLAPTAPAVGQAVPAIPAPGAQAEADNVVLRWNSAALQAVRMSKLGPPMVSRALAIFHTCIYDAWAAYDEKAVGTRLGASLRRPAAERTLANQNQAISFAAYRAGLDLFPGAKASVLDPLMSSLGYNANDKSVNRNSPMGVGNVACQAVLDFRHRDGSNQLGDMTKGRPGVPYSDYTGYKPVNDPMDLQSEFNPEAVRHPDRWQPLTYVDSTGAVVTPQFMAPFWNRVVPFAMISPDEHRSASGPEKARSPRRTEELGELLAISAGLTDHQKVVAEYWADGPQSELPPGHWNLFAQYVSRRDGHGASAAGVAVDVKMFFAITNAVFDAGIVAWDNKITYDSVRPITAIRHQFRGSKVLAWGGPYQGTKLIDGEDWLPYQPSTFPTPPFAEYSSGHSNFSWAGARILQLFTGSDLFGASVRVPAGSSKVEPGKVPATDVTLAWATFSQAADEAGTSRLYGGIHFTQGDVEARATGRMCADAVWAKAQALFNGISPG